MINAKPDVFVQVGAGDDRYAIFQHNDLMISFYEDK